MVEREPESPRRAAVDSLLYAALALLILQRLIYHVSYLGFDPFALATFSDGLVYEEAARDILKHPPLGTQPLYLQGLYAYLLALGIHLTGSLVGALVLQIAIGFAALAVFAWASCASFGRRVGLLSTIVLLAYPSVAFYENKYLSVSLGVAANAFALGAFVLASRRISLGTALALGIASGVTLLARPNLVLALPFTALALWTAARPWGARRWSLMLALALGVAMALGPMAYRNAAVIGAPHVFPSHGGGVPFYIGNNPHANGRWNDAGGLFTGQVKYERSELSQKLGIEAPPDEIDAAIGRALFARAFAYMWEQPLAWLWLEARKLYYVVGNHSFVRDYDLFGEREILGLAHIRGLPFGIVLALGVLGLIALGRGGDASSEALLLRRALWLVLLGQIVSVLVANLLWFTSAQNRVPLALPLAFVAGPALVALARRARAVPDAMWPDVAWPQPASIASIAFALALTLQAFWPRLGTWRPSSVHYYNLGVVLEVTGDLEAALDNYHRASERNPKQAAFGLREALIARRLGKLAQAEAALDRIEASAQDPSALRAPLARERALLERLKAQRDPQLERASDGP